MAKKKAAPKKKAASKKKLPPEKKPAPAKKTAPKKKAVLKKLVAKSAAKPTPKKKPAPKKSGVRKAGGVGANDGITRPTVVRGRRGLGSESGGQAGDTQGLSREEDVESESVEELTEEGQDYEAEIVSGVEHALDPDEGEVTTSEVPEDDVPEEYIDGDK
jgi:hypothetical protein